MRAVDDGDEDVHPRDTLGLRGRPKRRPLLGREEGLSQRVRDRAVVARPSQPEHSSGKMDNIRLGPRRPDPARRIREFRGSGRGEKVEVKEKKGFVVR